MLEAGRTGRSSTRYSPFMPRFRADVSRISPYTPGRPIADVAAEYGFDPASVVKLASNESPLPPFPAVQQVMAESILETNRYPDNDCLDLRRAIAGKLDVATEAIWVGGGSSELLRVIGIAVGGLGTSAVYAWPSFIIYRLASIIGMSEPIEIALAEGHRHDLDGMLAAIRPDTTVVYVCNPNNPTGSHLSGSEISAFLRAVPEGVLVVIDEAYHEYVTAPDYESAIPLVQEHRNVVVTRTFSKVFGLAALRVGYGVAAPEVIVELRKAQAPFTVAAMGQAAAIEALRHPAELAARVADNARGREQIEAGLAERSIEFVSSQANFVYFRMGRSTADTTTSLLHHGVIVRPFGDGWVRVSVGTEEENARFIAAL